MKSAVRQQHDGEWNKTVMQIVNEESRFTTWRVRMGALKSRLTEIRAAIAIGDDLRGNRYLDPPICTGKVHTRSCLVRIRNSRMKVENEPTGSVDPALSKKQSFYRKKHRVGPPRLVRWRCSIPWKNCKLIDRDRDEKRDFNSFNNRKEKEKWNFSTNISLFSQGKMDGFFLFEISRVKITFPRFSRVSPFYFSSLPFHFEPQRSPSFVSLLTHQLIVINNTLFEVWAKLLAWNCIFKFPFVIYRLFAAH